MYTRILTMNGIALVFSLALYVSSGHWYAIASSIFTGGCMYLLITTKRERDYRKRP